MLVINKTLFQERTSVKVQPGESVLLKPQHEDKSSNYWKKMLLGNRLKMTEIGTCKCV